MTTGERLAPMCNVCQVRHWARNGHVGQGGVGQTVVKAPRVASTADVKTANLAEERKNGFIVKVEGCRCRRPACGHEWVPRDKNKEPGYCPKCKSRAWNK